MCSYFNLNIQNDSTNRLQIRQRAEALVVAGVGTTEPLAKEDRRSQTAVQAFSGSTDNVKPGTTIIWSKWIAGVKEVTRARYRVQVKTMVCELPDEEEPVEMPDLTAAISLKANIELFRQSQRLYEEWKKRAESRKGIRFALLDRCNGQVKKALLARYVIDTIEDLNRKVTVFVRWICKQILELRSIKQRAVPTHIVIVNKEAQTQGKSPEKERKKYLKARDIRGSGKGTYQMSFV